MAKKASHTGAGGHTSKAASGHRAKAESHVKTEKALAGAMRGKSHPRMRK